jgi:hypothetical protein
MKCGAWEPDFLLGIPIHVKVLKSLHKKGAEAP